MNEVYQSFRLFKKKSLFTCMRIDKSTLPDGLYSYEIRHDEWLDGIPVELKDAVPANHWGTIITNKPIKIGPTGSIYLKDNDWQFENRMLTINEYMEESNDSL